ncbi:MAG: hypothetical protein HC916_20085, partial [Coleofasciculaceae cyanobacterium SM2_1_6]|nr:hypothetical protein [Coleofasciculaceae cyanobacterium SM2_1_6]
LSLQAGKKNGDSSNNIEVDDVAFQAIDVVNTLKFFPQTKIAAEALYNAGVGASLGFNVQQKSAFNITGFEVDYDNKRNGNELTLAFNGSGTLNIPIPSWLQKGQEFRFTPTIKPITNFQSFLNLGGKMEGSLDVKQLADELPIPDWLKDNVKNNLPDISLKDSITTPYWTVWQGKIFDPFSFTSAYKSNEISIKLS